MSEAELKKHLEEAEKNPKQIAAAVSGLTDKALRYKPAPNKWCIWKFWDIWRTLRSCTHTGSAKCWPTKASDCAHRSRRLGRNLGYMEIHPAELVALYGLNRHANIQLLRRLKPGDLEKSAYHPS